jgi:trigger factor
VQSRVEDLSTVVKKLQVELPQEKVKHEFDRAVGELSRTVRLKGFRAGHAPRRLVERFFGDDLRRDVAQRLVQGSIAQALVEHKLDPVAPPRVENGELEPASPFKYTATVEVRPVLDPKDYTGVSAPRLKLDVSDAEVDAALEERRRQHGRFEPIEGRDIVEQGDYATVDYEGFVDGAPIRGGKREGTLLECVPGSLLENKAETLVGAKVGETRALGVTLPADHQVAEYRGKEAQFTAVVRGIKRRAFPALDDAFAKDLGQDSLADLRANERKELESSKKERGEAAQRSALLEGLIAKNSFEVPPALVERNVDAMLKGMLRGFEQRGVDLRQIGVDLDRVRHDLRDRSKLEVRAYLLLEAIAEKEKLEVTDADLDAHFSKLAAEGRSTPEAIKAAFVKADKIAELKGRLRQDKAYAWVLERAALTD